MSRKNPLAQADKTEGLNPATLAMQASKTPVPTAKQAGKFQKPLIDDEDDKIALNQDESEVGAELASDDTAGQGGAPVHLAEVAGAPASDAPPAAAGSVSTGAAAGATAMGELGTGLLIAGGVIAVAAAAGGGGGGGSAAASTTVVSGTLVGGPVVAGNGLTIQLYQADGITTIKDASNNPITATLAADGSFTVDIGSYTGVVIAKVVDAGTGADYVDEATGQAVDLAANLMAMGIASGGTLTLNVNPLTTVAVLAAGANPTTTEVTDTNAAVAQAFGLTDLTGTSVVTTVDTSGAANAAYDPTTLSNAEKYGAVLAALSGMDQGSDAQTTINTLALNLTVNGSTGSLNTTALNALMSGAATADGNTTGNLLTLISDATAKSSASIAINTVATDNAINATEAGAGVTLTGANVAGATVSLSIGGTNRDAIVTGTTWSYTLQAADYTAMGQGGETITATASVTTGSGATAVTTTATATRAITVDTLAPAVAIASDDTALKAGETATLTFTFSEPPSGFSAADITASGGTLSGLARTADAKVYTAIFTPTPNTASGNASISVANNSYSDAAGNDGSGGNAPAISIDTLAPTVAISSDVSAVKIGETANITFTFSEDPSGFVAGDVITTGGSLTAPTVTADSKVYTATFTPSTSHEGNASITLAAGAYTDAAGNNGGAGITPAIAIDTLAPTLVVTSNDSALKIGETATVTFTFSSAPTDFTAGDVVTTGGSLSGLAVTADPKVYTATFTPSTDFEGSASISVAAATYTDAAGNTGGAGATPAITVDTLAPTATATISGADDNVPATSTVNIAPGSTTNDNTPTLKGTITGSLGVGEMVAVYDGATRLGAASVNGSDWSLTPGSLGNGAHSFSVRVEDTAGNQGTASAAYAFSIDATVPTATAPITGLADAVAMVTGNIVSGGVSNDPAPVLSGTITGALAAGDIVRVYDGATLRGDAIVSGATWSFSTTLLPGAHSFTTLVENAGGNQGATSNAYGVTLDFTPPAAPVLSLTNDSGSSNSDQITNNGALTTTGVEAGASVEYSTNAGGTWSGTFTPVSGSNTVHARQTDVAGNTSASSTFTFTFDNTAPATPTLALSNDTGSSNADRITSDSGLTFSAAAADVTRTFTVDGGAPAATYTAPTTDGSHTVVVTDTDTAGNTTNASLTFTLDTSIATPTVALTNDTGVSNSDGLSNDASLSSSVAAADVSRTFAVDGGAASATYTAPTTDGSHTVVVTDTDTAGNTANASVTFTLDTTLATPTLALSNDTGSSNADRISSDASLTFSAAAAGVTRTFTVDGGAATGSYTAPTTDGSHTVVVTDIDPAGNTRNASLTFTRDTTAPTQTVSGTDISADTGSSASDFNTSSAAQTITGTLSAALAAGDTLYGSVDNGAHWTDITAKANGTAISWDGATLAGSDTIGFRVTDQAGNVGGTTGTQAYTLDTTAPSFTSPASAVFPDQGTGTAYTAAATDANAVSYSLAGTDAGLFNFDANSGVITFKAAPNTAAPADAGGDNVYNFDVVATDLAGLSTMQAVAISVVNAPSLQASALDDVANFDVTSNIVLNYSESLVAVAGKSIHIINDGGTGFHNESTANTQHILVTDTAQVSIVGGKVTINPTFDLDLSNTYHIEIDAGAFTGAGSNLATAAVNDTTSLNFATVTPGSSALANAAQSQAMDATGALVNSYLWLDMEGIGSPSNASGTAFDLSGGSYALAAKNYNTAGAPTSSLIVAGDFYIAANNVGINDVFYVDNQTNGASYNLNQTTIYNLNGSANPPTTITFEASAGNFATAGGLGGQVDIALAGLNTSYNTFAALNSVYANHPLVITG